MKLVFMALLYFIVFTSSSVLAQPPIGKISQLDGLHHQLKNAQGIQRKVRSGTPLWEGDILTTGTTQIRLNYIDGSQVVVPAHSEYRVDSHIIAPQNHQDNGLMTVIKGGLRRITGLIN